MSYVCVLYVFNDMQCSTYEVVLFIGPGIVSNTWDAHANWYC